MSFKPEQLAKLRQLRDELAPKCEESEREKAVKSRARQKPEKVCTVTLPCGDVRVHYYDSVEWNRTRSGLWELRVDGAPIKEYVNVQKPRASTQSRTKTKYTKTGRVRMLPVAGAATDRD